MRLFYAHCLLAILSLCCISDTKARKDPAYIECDDDPFRRFYVSDTEKNEPCVWLAARPEYHEEYCDPGHESIAFFICRETCGACEDDCDDTEGYFLYKDIPRPCLWLNLRTWLHDDACTDPNSEARIVCPETCNICDTEIAPSQSDVVVIGAGASGISTTKRLKDVDPSLNIQVLEASERIGGRVRSEMVGIEENKWMVEMGASWAFVDQPSGELARKYNLSKDVTDYFNIAVWDYTPCKNDGQNRRSLQQNQYNGYLSELQDLDEFSEATKILAKRALRRLQFDSVEQCEAKKIPEAEVDAAFEVWSQTLVCTNNATDALWCEEVDEDGNYIVDVGMLATFIECGYDGSETPMFKWKWLYFDSEYSYKDGSMYGWGDYFTPNISDVSEFVTDQNGGYESIIQEEANENNIDPIFDQLVYKIKYDHDNGDYKALVYAATMDGVLSIYEAKRVVSTVPAPVYNEELIEFEPELRYPAIEYNPIERGMWLKIFYQFNTTFWEEDKDKDWIYTGKSRDNDGISFQWMNMEHILPGSNMLMGNLQTEPFDMLVTEEQQRKGEIPESLLLDLLEPLKIIYNNSFEEPISITTNKWFADRNSGYGAWGNWIDLDKDAWDYFAFWGQGSDGENETNYYIQDICEHNGCNGEPGLNGTEWILHLSGSAACERYWETVTGAWVAGYNTANYVLKSLGYEMEPWYDPCYSDEGFNNEDWETTVDDWL